MFQVCDLVLINKIDVIDYFNFSVEKVKENIKLRNEKADVLLISALKNEGIDAVCSYLENKIEEWRK